MTELSGTKSDEIPSNKYIVEFDSHRRLILSAILVFYFAVVAVSNSQALTFLNPVRLCLTVCLEGLGLYQTWNLFSPDVRATNFYVSALVEYEDGGLKMVEFPRMNLLGYGERLQKQKMRKLFVDCWASPEMKPFREEEAKYVARSNMSANANVNTNIGFNTSASAAKPKIVRLTLNWSPVPAPDQNHFVRRQNVPPEFNRDTYFIYNVKPEDLLQ